MSRLKAKAPDATKITKPKVLVFGPPGVGKSWIACDFPRAYYIDTEGGCEPPKYQKKLQAAGSVYMGKEDGSQHFGTVVDQIRALAQEKHEFLTLVIDSFSKLYNLAAAEAELKVGSDFGKDRKEANKPTRQLMTWLERIDMNVLLICHSKEKWARAESGGKKELVSLGQTFDGWEKMEYDLHLCVEVLRDGAHVRKSRIEGFPRDAAFEWSFKQFEKMAGRDLMLRPAKEVAVADAKTLAKLHHLLATVKMGEGWEEKVLAKAGVEQWEDMELDKVQKCIEVLQAQTNPEAAKAAE